MRGRWRAKAGGRRPLVRLVEPGETLSTVLSGTPVTTQIVLKPGTHGRLLAVPHGSDSTRVIRGLPGAIVTSGNSDTSMVVTGNRYYFSGFEVRAGGATATCIELGSATTSVLADQPDDITLDNMTWRGDATNGCARGVGLHSKSTTIRNCFAYDIKRAGSEAQGICGWNGPGPYLIEGNYIEGSAQSIMFGGSDPEIANLIPSDITIRGNTFTRPLSWQGVWLHKTCFELKNAQRVLIEKNIIENSWQSGQVGYLVTFTPRNQGLTAPWSVVKDITFRYNVCRHGAGGLNLLGFDDDNGDAVIDSEWLENVQIYHNLFYDVDSSWGEAGTGHFLQIGDGPINVAMWNNTAICSGKIAFPYGSPACTNFSFKDSLLRHNSLGIHGDGQGVGNTSINTYFPGGGITGNVFAGATAGDYTAAPNTTCPTNAAFEAEFVDYANEDFRLDVGSPYTGKGVDYSKLPSFTP
jgi:hypothetical protein